jgi:uncharacterized membrane protein
MVCLTASSQNFASATSPGNGDAAPTFALYGALGLFGILVLVEIDDRYIGAFARKEHGNGAADTGIAGDDRGVTF